MEWLVCLFILCTTCWATPQDLSGKMFMFPEESNSSYVRLTPTGENFTAVSVCLRFSSGLSRSYSLFSLATPAHPNAFSWFRTVSGLSGADGLQFIDVQGQQAEQLGECVPICGTWDSETGLLQVWIHSENSSSTVETTEGRLNGTPIVIIGQDQDVYGGGFEARQSFVGLISDIHMWDYVLTFEEIGKYMNDFQFTPGNILNWKALEYSIHGNAHIEFNKIPCYY